MICPLPFIIFSILSIVPTMESKRRRRPPPLVDHFLREDIMTSKQHNMTVILHNYLRGHVQPNATNMFKLVFDAKLQENAQNYSKECHYEHREEPIMVGDREVGENLYVRSKSEKNLTFVLDRAINTWFDEHDDYNYQTRTCADGAVCGHYTQMVWADTRYIGCGISTCQNIKSGTKSYPRGQLMVCNYSPVGNYKGENPYNTGASCSDPRCNGGENCVCDRGYDRLYEYAHLKGVNEYIGGISGGSRVRSGTATNATTVEELSTTQSTPTATTKVKVESSTNDVSDPIHTQPNITAQDKVASAAVTPKAKIVATPKTTTSQAPTTTQSTPNVKIAASAAKTNAVTPTITSTTAKPVLQLLPKETIGRKRTISIHNFSKVTPDPELLLRQRVNKTIDSTPNPRSGAVRSSFCFLVFCLSSVFVVVTLFYTF